MKIAVAGTGYVGLSIATLFSIKLDMNFDYLFRSSYMPV